MTDAGWWARKLGRAPEMPTPPANYPPPGYAPSGSVPPPAMPAMPVQSNGGPAQVWIDDPNALNGKRLNWRAWNGGQATREETARCPQCGSSNFFSRRQNAIVTQNGMAYPAPQCAECSYNGNFTIYGG